MLRLSFIKATGKLLNILIILGQLLLHYLIMVLILMKYIIQEIQKNFGEVMKAFSINSPTLTRNFTRNWPYKYSEDFPVSNPVVNQQVTLQFTVKNPLSFSRNVKVQIWIDKNKSDQGWQQISPFKVVDGNGGTKPFDFNFTPTSSGTYYLKYRILTYNDGANNYIPTDSYFWTELFTAIEQKGTFELSVKNVNGNFIENAKVKLYLNGDLIDTNYTDYLGKVSFSNLSYDSYHYEVYYNGETEEFWGDNEIEINSPSVTKTFSRNWPYKYSDNLPIRNVISDQGTELKFTIKNPLSFSRNVKVQIWIDKNKSDQEWYETSVEQLINGNDEKEFIFTYTPILSGSYYYKYRILTYNDGANNYIPTDSYFWNDAFTINQTSLPNLNGIIAFHTYTSYLNFDATIHIINFSARTITNLNFNDWDGCSNPSLSPDGKEMVFMAVPHTNHDYNALEIVLYNLQTGNIKRLTENNVADEDPKFSPNGMDETFKRNKDLYKINIDNNWPFNSHLHHQLKNGLLFTHLVVQKYSILQG